MAASARNQSHRVLQMLIDVLLDDDAPSIADRDWSDVLALA